MSIYRLNCDMEKQSRTSTETRLGDLLIQQRLVTAAQLMRALERQRLQGGRVTLGQILVSQEILTQRQLDAVLDSSGKRLRLGDVLLRHGTISREQLEHALAKQRKTRRPLGAVLIELGYVDDAGVRQALANQLDIPFIELDRMSLDRSLSRIVNATYARRHSIVPVAVAGQMLTLCMDDPTQRSVVEELNRAVTTTSTSAARREREFLETRLNAVKIDLDPGSNNDHQLRPGESVGPKVWIRE